jgi:KaiC/GvpD/RAD55 family RecA-like ATPase
MPRKRMRKKPTVKNKRGKVLDRKFVEFAKECERLRPVMIGTDVPGFDTLIDGGGIPSGTSVLVSGGPGSGKTIFCMQVVNNLANVGKKCFYLSFEESPERLRQRASMFGWNIGELVRKGKLTIHRMDPLKVSRSIEALYDRAGGEEWIPVTKIPGLTSGKNKPQIVVVDSVTALESAFAGKPEHYRIYIEQLFRLLEKIGATSFVITEPSSQEGFSRTGVEEFLADGVIAMHNFKAKFSRLRGIEIIKLRGSKHISGMVPMEITSEGIEVFPGERFFEAE